MTMCEGSLFALRCTALHHIMCVAPPPRFALYCIAVDAAPAIMTTGMTKDSG